MRSGVCALQQTLTAEAASVLKHSLGLAKRRGHAQVTPLHVAATLLTSRASLLRRACLKSHHQNNIHNHNQNIIHQPLQCRALELCFNVALNRLPTSGGPLLHSHHQPSLSNALIAALKRAQAHQRRGSIEQQQHHQQAQPLLTIKVELEQLIISILDDPSVSRVMREAGFSSTAVKNNLEEDSSSVSSINNSVFLSPSSSSNFVLPNFWHTHFLSYSSEQNPLLFSPPKGEEDRNFTKFKDDIMVVFDVLLRKKKRNTVIVGDSVSVTEGLVGELMGRFERGEVPKELRRTHFVKFQFSPISLKFTKREDVERNLLELKRKVECLVSGGEGVIVYTGDLKWTIVDHDDHDHQRVLSDDPGLVSSCYSPADHLVSEISRLIASRPKVWIMATASYQTYMKCQMREAPLDVQWALQAVSVPSSGLSLSLHAATASSVHDSRIMFSQSPETKPLLGSKDEILQDHKLIYCSECASHCDKEAQLLKSGHQKLPAWLQPQCGTQPHHKEELVELRRKWSRLCQSLHQGKHSQSHVSSTMLTNNPIILTGNKGTTYNSCSYSSSYPWWPAQNTIFQDSNSFSFADSASKPASHGSGLAPGQFSRQQSCTIEFSFGGEETRKLQQQHDQEVEPSLDTLRRSSQEKEVKITLALGNSVFSDSGKWEDRKIERSGSSRRAEMCRVLKENVPWQSETIPSIVEAMIVSKSAKRETCWLLIPGNDTIGKRRLARAIAESVLGSSDLLLQLNTNTNNPRNRNAVSPESDQLVLAKALKTQKKLVVLVEDIDSADTQLLKFLADGFETGKFGESDLGEAIFVLTKGDIAIHENDMKIKDSVIHMTFNVSETTTTNGNSFEALKFSRKRKATEWDLPNREFAKNPRMDEKKNSLSRQSSFNTLDLNVKADEEDDDGSEDKPGDLSPISSDLTGETPTTELRNPVGFVESIENLFVFNRSPARDREMTELFESKMEESFSEICQKQKSAISFSVEETVLEDVCIGSGCFSNTLFEKWVNDVFQTALKTVRFSGKEGSVVGGGDVRLCLGGKEEGILEVGFMGSCLPNKIQVSYKD
ncbi:Butenolide signaling repressing protein-like [Parasponia andersonii]|uniref:Butenolide signaling repressing protein-like n=1 Tax=Parasponia andersonii TaxID=3476 RepID=A0A2P5E1V1_PARAD|nr:Butenolide signaling repressing protein-like [Parasponia andersonii]